jgi:adenylate kinase
VLKERLNRKDARKGAILDGFPRTLKQAGALDDLLQKLRKKINAVFYIRVSDDILVERLSQRLICRECHAPFHKVYKPFQLCPDGKCHGQYLYQRPDDQPETVKHRLRTFHASTAPLIDYYKERGLLKTVEGVGSAEEIGKAIIDALPDFRKSHP